MFDVLIVNGDVADGELSSLRTVDVGIEGDRIAAIGNLYGAEAKRTIDASRMIVCPGFVDIHNHAYSDVAKGVFDCDNLVRQGITTLVGANCGGSPWPIGENLDIVDQHGMRQNYALIVGHNTIRREAMGDRYAGLATHDDITKMQELVEQALDEGAFGITGGYSPDQLTTEEIIEICKPAALREGFYAAHIRGEGKAVMRAVAEMIEIAEDAEIPAEIAHFKMMGPKAWGKADICLAMIDDARARGHDVTADWYPYGGWHGGSNNIMPSWGYGEAKERGGYDALKAPDLIDRLRAGVQEMCDKVGGPDRLLFTSLEDPDPEIDLKTPAQLAEEWSCELIDVAIAISRRSRIGAIGLAMREEDMVKIIKHPAVMVGTDAHLEVFGKFATHPRNYGTFPRVLAKYVREDRALLWCEAIRKMTSMPARKIGLKDRGLVKQGYIADLVVFCPETVQDKATFANAHQYPEGIPYVLVGGKLAVDEGETTEGRHGRAVRSGK